jgi:pyruvate formate lyase activating enzyme
MAMKPALLYEKLPDNYARCGLCYRRCRIGDGLRGFCRSRLNRGGNLFSLNYGILSVVQATPIEEKPFLQFRPGTTCLSIGTFGCNFRCKGCQNHLLSWNTVELDALAANSSDFDSCVADQPELANIRQLTPEAVIDEALNAGCQGIAFTYQEPTIWAEFVQDTAQLAKQRGLYTVYVTNGWLTPENLDLIGPHIDAIAPDIKSLNDGYYINTCGIPGGASAVLETCIRAVHKYGMHLETRTCVIPGFNDDDETFREIAAWIIDNMGRKCAWHLLRFFPKHEFSHLPPTPLATLAKARQIGARLGLRNIHIHDAGCCDCSCSLVAKSAIP